MTYNMLHRYQPKVKTEQIYKYISKSLFYSKPRDETDHAGRKVALKY